MDERKESDPGVGMRSKKMWIDSSLVEKLKERDAAYKQGNVTRNNSLVKQYKYDLRRLIKMAKHKYRDKVEEKFSRLDTRRVWQRLLVITD